MEVMKKLCFAFLLVTNDKSCFGGIIIFIRRVPPSNLVVVTLADFLTKGLFLMSATQTLPTFNGGNCSFDVFLYLDACFQPKFNAKSICV